MLNITPAIRVTNNECEYFSFGDNIKIETYSQKRFSGIFLFMDLSQDPTIPDCVVIGIGNESIHVYVEDIKSIVKLSG